MRAENFFLLINEIDEELVLEAEGEADHEVGQSESARPKIRFPFKGAIAAAACFALLAAGIFMIAKIRMNRPVTSDMNNAGYGGSVETGGTDNAPPEANKPETKPADTGNDFTVVDPVDSRISFVRDWNSETSWSLHWNGDDKENLMLLNLTESNEASLKYLEDFFGTDSLPIDDQFKGELKREMVCGQYVCSVSDGAKAYSPVEGRVVAASEGYNGGLGAYVAVEFDSDKIFAVTHLDEVYAEVGDTVSAGQALGVCGHSGRVAVDYPPSFRLLILVKVAVDPEQPETKPAGTEGVFKVVDPVDSRIGFERVKSFEPDWNLEYYSWVSRWSGELDEQLKLLGQTESNEASLKCLEEFFGTDSLPVDEKYKNELQREMYNGQYVCNVSEGAKAYSPVEGRVIAVSEHRYNEGLGAYVAVEFDSDKIFAVTHLDEVNVEVGDTVSAGQALGVCGHSGRVYAYDPPLFRLITLIKLIKVDVPPEASEPEAYFKEPSPEDIVIDKETGISYVKNQLLISAFPGAKKEEVEQIAAELGAEIVGYIELTNDYQIEFTKDMTLAELEAATDRIFDSSPHICSVGLNHVMTTNYDNNPELDHHVDGFLD